MSPARAQNQAQDTTNEPLVFDVVQISGFVDRIVADFIETSIDNAEAGGSGGLILQVNSTWAVVSDERLVELAEKISEAEVPNPKLVATLRLSAGCHAISHSKP